MKTNTISYRVDPTEYQRYFRCRHWPQMLACSMRGSALVLLNLARCEQVPLLLLPRRVESLYNSVNGDDSIDNSVDGRVTAVAAAIVLAPLVAVGIKIMTK